MTRSRRTRTRAVGQRRSSGPARTRKNVRRAKRAALIVGAVKARKAGTRRRRVAAAAAEAPMKIAEAPRKARIGKR